MSGKVERLDAVGRKGPKLQRGRTCRSCGTLHAPDSCPATGRRCHKCKRLNHFARTCHTPGEQRKQVNVVDDYNSMFIGAVNVGDQDWMEA